MRASSNRLFRLLVVVGFLDHVFPFRVEPLSESCVCVPCSVIPCGSLFPPLEVEFCEEFFPHQKAPPTKAAANPRLPKTFAHAPDFSFVELVEGLETADLLCSSRRLSMVLIQLVKAVLFLKIRSANRFSFLAMPALEAL